MIAVRRLTAALALLLVTAAPGAGAPSGPQADARAWALWVHLPGQPVVQVATADASLGARPLATATPVAVGGVSPRQARADADVPAATDELGSWLDPTASLSLNAGTMEARAGANAASARVSAATGGASGFAMADELFTWEQQEQLLGAWGDANAAVMSLANEVLAPLGPVLAPRNLVVPRLEPMAPLGFVDVAGDEQLAARAETASSPGFVSAVAAADVSRLRMFGGFVELDDVRVRAQVEHLAGDRTAQPSVSVGRLRIAGIEVDVGESGLVVASNDLVSRSVLQPVLDQLAAQLADVGIRIDVATSRDVDGRLQASALEFEIATPDGMAIVSVGHAETTVTAATVPTGEIPPPTTPVPPPPTDQPPPADTAGAGPPRSLPPSPASAVSAPSSPTAPPAAAAPPAVATPPPPTAIALRLAAQPPEAARMLQLAWLIVAAGAVVGLTTVLALVGARPPTRRRPPE